MTIDDKCKIVKGGGKCLLATLIWGMLAHAYAFLNLTVSRDSLEALYSGTAENIWKISIGRVFVPAYRTITRGFLTTPWLIGLLALLWIGIAVFFIVEMFELESNAMIVLVSGIMTTNYTVISLAATYMHDLDVDMFALLLAIGAVYLWNRNPKAILLGTVLVAISIGLYQSYFSVAIILIMMLSIMQLLKGTSFKLVVTRGILGIAMLFSGGLLYMVSVKLICWLEQTPMINSYNSTAKLWDTLNSDIRWKIIDAYKLFFSDFLNPVSVYPAFIIIAANIALGVCLGIYAAYFLSRKAVGIIPRILFLFLGVLIPFAVNLSYILSGGVLHGLMKYAFWLLYLLVILISRWYRENSVHQRLRTITYYMSVILVFGIVWNNIPVANAAYLKKDLERQQTLSLMTRVVDELNERDDYIEGETPVAIIGKINADLMPGFEMFAGDGSATGLIGLAENDQIKNWRDYKSYFRYVLNNNARICDYEQYSELLELPQIEGMPIFPQKGCMQMINGILFVKMGTDY